jgi:hypothetical protein
MRRAAMMFLVVAAFATSAASAQVRVTMTGVVTDVLGVALIGATVSDGPHSTTTGPGGTWSLIVDPAVVNTITASKTGYVTVSQTVVPLAQPSLNFALPFKILSTLSPTVFTSTGQISLEARSLMPPAGNCMIATDDRTGQGITLVFVSTDPAGLSKWVGAIALPANPQAGFFHVTFEGRNCSTLKTLTDKPAGAYAIDKQAPSIEIITPAEGFLTIGVVPLPSRDGSTRVFGPVFVQVDAADDLGLTFGTIEITPSVGSGCSQHARGAKSYRYICGPFIFLRAGEPYTLTVNVSDLAGRTSTATMMFRVAGGQ